MTNKLILIGNGFDLAHSLKTSYKDFIDWYFCKTLRDFCGNPPYSDSLLEINNRNIGRHGIYGEFTTLEEVVKLINANDSQTIKYKSLFFKRIVELLKNNNWVDVERLYYKQLKDVFTGMNPLSAKKSAIINLNREFDSLIVELAEYLTIVNASMHEIPKLHSDKMHALFEKRTSVCKSLFLNFNYTETLLQKAYANEEDVIFIHGRATENKKNPIIFGYGDETDPIYQNIEDSGENIFLEHIKSFGYFRTNNYHRLISYIDSDPYTVYILGHSCGLSDRVLLSEIFEHQNCENIEIFYHVRNDGTDNFKEITQEISRHFKPQNKNLMRRKVVNKNIDNILPQNTFS
ncbi:MAG TPA: AbiH family protein [Paludibacter sp.]|nr:AbiH family protein [Paludibacter sp.]